MTYSASRMMYTREYIKMSCDYHMIVYVCFHSYRATTGTGEMKERDIILDGKHLHNHTHYQAEHYDVIFCVVTENDDLWVELRHQHIADVSR